MEKKFGEDSGYFSYLYEETINSTVLDAYRNNPQALINISLSDKKSNNFL